jgi:hypothetical protein
MRGPIILLFMSLMLSSALAQDHIPNISGLYACTLTCQKQTKTPYILQTGGHVLCVNEVGAETNGELSPMSTSGRWEITCWGSVMQNGGITNNGTVLMNKDGFVDVIIFDHVTKRDGDETWHTESHWQPLTHAVVPNFSGHFSCTGNCHGATTLQQNGSNVICINDVDHNVSYGTVTGPQTFDGCWGLHATVSKDMSQIDWHQGSVWIRN